MNRSFDELAAALRERLAIIADEASRKDEARHMQRLQAISERIDELQRQLPADADARLKHFLQQRSYGKALAHLAGEAAQ